MKKFIFASITCCLWMAALAQNVGINALSPTSTLDVNGGFRLRPLETIVIGTSVPIPVNRSHHVLGGEPTSNFTITFTGTVQQGQHIIITNITLVTAILATQSIAAGTTSEFIFSFGAWRKIGSSETASGSSWALTGNASTNEDINFIGTTNDKPLIFRVNNIQAGLINRPAFNVAFGYGALIDYKNTNFNVAIGNHALAINGADKTLNEHSQSNIAIGNFALTANRIGNRNIAVGNSAMYSNRNGFNSVAIGNNALYNDESAIGIVAVGSGALFNNNNNRSNTAVGLNALYENGIGADLITLEAIENTAVGSEVMLRNKIGSQNTAVGYAALYSNRKGNSSVAIGNRAALSDTVAMNVIAIGSNALRNSQSGQNNIAIGSNSLHTNLNGNGNVAIGHESGRAELGSNKLYIESSNANKDNALIYGDFAADSLLLNTKTINKFSLNVRGSNALEMGYGTTNKQTDAGKICYGCFGDPVHWLGIVGGGTSILGNDRVIKLWSEGGLRIKGHALPDLDNSYSLGNNTNRWNQVWAVSGIVNSSDANLKTNIMASPYGLDEVMQMNPVQYNWKTNPNEDLQIGFLAQDIQKIIPEAVVVPDNGSPLGMKYTELIPVLVKAIQELKNEITELKKQLKK